MQVAATAPSNNPQVEQLRAMLDNPRASEQQKAAEAAKQFETVMLHQIVKQTMKPVVEGALNKEGAGHGIYEYFMTQSLAEGLSAGGGFGLADSLTQQLTRQQPLSDPSAMTTTAPPVEPREKLSNHE